MSDKCFEIGAIQAFLDGETSPDLSFKISGHVADCDSCALALAAAEEESSIVFSALDREFNSLVPTQRLWSSINEAICYEKAHTSFWDKIRVSVFTLLANPSLTVAASVLIVFGLFAVIWNLNPAVTRNSEISNVSTAGLQQPQNQAPVTASVPVRVNDSPDMLSPGETALKVTETKHSPAKLKSMMANANVRSTEERPRPQYLDIREPVEEYLPGEESYVRTISDLKQNVDGQKDRILDPSTRIAYERDMAVVNDAIRKMKDVVKKNPRNQSAKQVLYSSYQNKIDLLNSVAEREELMASFR